VELLFENDSPDGDTISYVSVSESEEAEEKLENG